MLLPTVMKRLSNSSLSSNLYSVTSSEIDCITYVKSQYELK